MAQKYTYAGFANTFIWQGREYRPGDTVTIADADYRRLTRDGHTFLKEGDTLAGFAPPAPVGRNAQVGDEAAKPTPYQASNGITPADVAQAPERATAKAAEKAATGK